MQRYDAEDLPAGIRAALKAGRIVDDRRDGIDRRHDDAREVTLGEVYRLCLAIQTDVKAQNGRVNALEKDAIRVKTLWTAAVVIFGFFGDYIRHKIGLS